MILEVELKIFPINLENKYEKNNKSLAKKLAPPTEQILGYISLLVYSILGINYHALRGLRVDIERVDVAFRCSRFLLIIVFLLPFHALLLYRSFWLTCRRRIKDLFFCCPLRRKNPLAIWKARALKDNKRRFIVLQFGAWCRKHWLWELYSVTSAANALKIFRSHAFLSALFAK